MKFEQNQHHRRSIRLEGYDYTTPGGYFITFVTQGRACLFGDIVKDEMQYSEKGQIAYECWRAIPDHFPTVELGAFVIMPNHVHGIIILREDVGGDAVSENRSAILSPTVGATHWVAPTNGRKYVIPTNGPQRGSIGAIIGAYKMSVTRKIVAQFGGVPDLWQRNYYEHIIRNDEEHKRIHLYIESNPVHWNSDAENPEMTP